EQRGAAQRLAPQLRGSLGGLELAEREQLERPHDAMAVVGVDAAGRPWSALGERRVQRRRAAPLELGYPALAHALGGWGPQVELGERRAQVQPGPTHDDRPPARLEQ